MAFGSSVRMLETLQRIRALPEGRMLAFRDREIADMFAIRFTSLPSDQCNTPLEKMRHLLGEGFDVWEVHDRGLVRVRRLP